MSMMLPSQGEHAITSLSARLIRILLLGLMATFVMACDSEDDNRASQILHPKVGIFWYGKNDANQKHMPGQLNPYYDSTKPTIIFVHGWQPDQAYTHRTMLWQFEDRDTGETVVWDLASAWIDAGWNIGIFDWGPFADEELVIDAEAKIWAFDGNKGMRWRNEAGDYETEGVARRSAGELFYTAYMQALADFSGPELRLAGHSLGNQMAVDLMGRLSKGIAQGTVAPQLLPDRLALLDPYWSPLAQDYLDGETTADQVRNIIELDIITRDIPVEWYRSSSLTDGFLISVANEALQDLVVFTELRPRYCTLAEQICKHEAAWQSYFLSFASPPPPECEPLEDDSCVATGRFSASASSANARLTEMMAEPYTWVQIPGPSDIDSTLTRETGDDWFARQPVETPH